MVYKSLSELQENKMSPYQWLFLILVTLTGTVVAIQSSCMPVLFKEMSDDLGLSLVQIGSIWGMSTMAGIFVAIIAGILSDRLGAKFLLTVLCLLVGLTGALRGLSNSFFILAVTVFLNGMVRLMIPINLTKLVSVWFKGPRLGMAIGMSAMGMGLGMMIGPMVSATFLSPWLGGWRNVMYFFGGVAILFGILWFIFGREMPGGRAAASSGGKSLIQSLTKVIKIKAVWLMGIAMLFRVGGMVGVTGYVALYLRAINWTPAAADGALTLSFAVSTMFALPLSLLSDRIGLRKAILLPIVLLAVVSTALIPVVPDSLVWVLMIIFGAFFDGSMAVSVTILLESEGVNAENSGMAVGMFYTIFFVGAVVSPPIGNSFADAGAGMPFFFWAGLGGIAFILFLFVKETGWKKKRAAGMGLPAEKLR